MSLYSREDKIGMLGLIDDLSPDELALIDGAVWNEADQVFVVGVWCHNCSEPYYELLITAIQSLVGVPETVCIKCDPSAEVSSGVTLISRGGG